MGENVKIPLSLFKQTVDLLECIDVTNFDPILSCYHQSVLSAFLRKGQRLDLRRAYSKIIFAEDEDKRFDARMRYLQMKHDIADEF